MAGTQAQICRTVTAASVAKALLEHVATGVRESGHVPTLIGFLANTDSGARMYAEWTGKTCTKNGIKFELREVSKEDLRAHIEDANNDAAVDGIMVYYPVFDSEQDQTIKETVCPTKDVEGLNTGFMVDLYEGPPLVAKPQQQIILPTTPMAMVEILRHLEVYDVSRASGSQLLGKSITVINRSDVVGKPLAALLAHEGANVYSVDISGIQVFRKAESSRRVQVTDQNVGLQDCLALSDVVISGVPGDRFKVPLESLKHGSICLNFSSEKNFDNEVKNKASVFVPSIGGVTVAVLMRNLLYLVENRRRIEQQTLTNPTRQDVMLDHFDAEKSWFFRFFAGRSIVLQRTLPRTPAFEYAVCFVGFSIGLLSWLW